MYNIEINSSLSRYSVQIKETPFRFADFNHRFWLVDGFFRDSFSFLDNVYFLEVREDSKTLETCEELIGFLSERGCTRKDTLGVIGGGFIQDIATLVASLYMRGIHWSYFPTTLMSMVDSCIGGKSSINARGKKNVIGNFYPPNIVNIFTTFIETLDHIDIAAGLLEAIKICFSRNTISFDMIRQDLSTLSQSAKGCLPYTQLILNSLESKRWFLEVDEFDQNERQLLNFGHTFGHALESASSYKIPHGIAVGFGMLAAIEFIPNDNQKRLEPLRKLTKDVLRFSEFDLSKAMPIDKEVFLRAFDSDKKHTLSDYTLILPNETGVAKVTFPRSPATREAVFVAMQKVLRVI